jgi:hypothetical protein
VASVFSSSCRTNLLPDHPFGKFACSCSDVIWDIVLLVNQVYCTGENPDRTRGVAAPEVSTQ